MPEQSRDEEAPGREFRGKRLDSWKEIAGYLNRHVTTVRRWERHEGLPVHRHRHARLGSIYAYTRELDTWFESRREAIEALAAGFPGHSHGATDRLPSPPWVSAASRAEPVLTGREHERGLLERVWERACRGEQQVVLATGEPGIGKTRLALEFARSVARRATVLVGRCDREALVGYAPWIGILQWMIRTTPAEILRQRVAAIDASCELVEIVPELASRVHLGKPSVPTTPEGRRYRMFEAASELLAAASRRAPLLVLIDDLHWADRESLLLLRHVLRSTRHSALCLVLTHREDVPEWSPEFRDVLESVGREHATTRVALQRLSPQHVRHIIASWTGREVPEALAAFVARHTEGHPLYVVEMLKHLQETDALDPHELWRPGVSLADVGLPLGIRQLIGRRLDRLRPVTRRLLTLGAVMGREFRLPVIEALLGEGEDAVLDAIDEALAAGVVAEEAGSPGRFSFTHTLVRETLYTSITATRRVRLHQRIGSELERHAAAGTARLTELAYHFGEAAAFKDAEKAVDCAIRAGDHEHDTLALEAAAHWYDVALRSMDFTAPSPGSARQRSDLHAKRGRSLLAVGQWAAAKQAFEAAASLLGPGQLETRCQLAVRLAETSFWLMDVPALRGFAAEAQALAAQLGRDDLWAEAQAWLASAMVSDGDVLTAVEMDRTALDRAGGIRSFGQARAPLTLYWAGRAEEAVQRARQAVDTARTSEDPSFLLYALQHLGLGLSGSGRFDEAVKVFDEARAFGRRCGALPLLARATSMSVAPLMSLGDLPGAMARALEARDLAHRVAFEPPLVSAGIDLLLIFARQQEPGRADALLRETRDAVRKAAGWHGWKWSMRLAQATAELALARGACDDAVRAATEVVEQSRARHRLKYEALGRATRARAAHQLRLGCAATEAMAAVAVARRLGDPAVLLECLFAAREVDGRDEWLGQARQTVSTIVQSLADGPMRVTFSSSVRSRAPGVLAP